MDRPLRRLAPALIGAGLLLASEGRARAGDLNFPICGDSVVQAPIETCDDGNTLSGDGCSGVTCNLEVCDDDILNVDPAPGPAEECDDGNTVGDDGCDASCQLECGNGTLEGAETCDHTGESATCDDDCTAVACGDDNVNEASGETCEPPSVGTCDAECHSSTVAQLKPQQACINGINANGTGVLKAQDKDISGCVKSVAS